MDSSAEKAEGGGKEGSIFFRRVNVQKAKGNLRRCGKDGEIFGISPSFFCPDDKLSGFGGREKIRFQTFNKMEKERKRNIDRRKEICYTYDNDNRKTFGNYGGRYDTERGYPVGKRAFGIRKKRRLRCFIMQRMSSMVGGIVSTGNGASFVRGKEWGKSYLTC